MIEGSLNYYYGPGFTVRRSPESMAAPPKIVNGSIMVIAEYFIEALGGTVAWDTATSTVKINIDPERRGNTPGNHANGSIAAFVGDTVFFAAGRYLRLYRVNTAENISRRMLVSEHSNVENINVLDGWVFYTFNRGQGIAKTRTSGSESPVYILLRTDGVTVDNMQVVGDWIYFNLSNNLGIYRLPTNPERGTTPVKVVDRSLGLHGPFCVSYDRIYFTDSNRESMSVSAVDGSRTIIIGYDYAEYTNVVDGWIYYIDVERANLYNNGGNIVRVRIGGGDRQVMYWLPNARTLNVFGDWMYFHADDGQTLCRARIDGSNFMIILKEFDMPEIRFIKSIAINGEWVYFKARNLQNNQIELYRIRMNSSGAEAVEKVG